MVAKPQEIDGKALQGSSIIVMLLYLLEKQESCSIRGNMEEQLQKAQMIAIMTIELPDESGKFCRLLNQWKNRLSRLLAV